MTKRRVIFLTLPSGVFGNAGQVWLGIDLSPAKDYFRGQGFEVISSTIDQTHSLDTKQGDIVVYCSCEAPEIREYMKDVFYFINMHCRLVPNYEFLLSYENKGFQELNKKEIGIGNLSGSYHFDIDSGGHKFPFVFKLISGAGSSGVRLIRDEKDIENLKNKYFVQTLRRRMICFLRKQKLMINEYLIYRYRHKPFRRHVRQELIPELQYDYKILVYGDRLFGMKRHVRANDFRASGSGNFDFSAPIPDHVLDYAAEIADRLDAPQLSLDIADADGVCHLIEYQGLNFGPITLNNSNRYFVKKDQIWEEIQGTSDISECFVHSLIYYFKRHAITSDIDD